MIRDLAAFCASLKAVRAPGVDFTFEPDEAARAAMAKALGLAALPAYSAEARLEPWLDGAELSVRWKGQAVQICGVTLDPFSTDLAGTFLIRMVPSGSPNAVKQTGEVVLELEQDDPPDELVDDRIDLAAYAIEHLGLELDPFPRSPGATFEPPEPTPIISPFADLGRLKS